MFSLVLSLHFIYSRVVSLQDTATTAAALPTRARWKLFKRLMLLSPLKRRGAWKSRPSETISFIVLFSRRAASDLSHYSACLKQLRFLEHQTTLPMMMAVILLCVGLMARQDAIIIFALFQPLDAALAL